MPYHAQLKQKCVYHCNMTFPIRELTVALLFIYLFIYYFLFFLLLFYMSVFVINDMDVNRCLRPFSSCNKLK